MSLLDMASAVVVVSMSLTVIFAFIRLARGPSLPDRVVALDLMSTVGIGVIAVYAIRTDQPVFLDVAIILALVSFLGTVAFAYYLERRGPVLHLSSPAALEENRQDTLESDVSDTP